jgi:hypothetical protein
VEKLAILSVLFFAATLILLPSSSSAKYDVSKLAVADGSPLPWPPIPNNAVLITDGYPLPPFPPNPSLTSVPDTLLADGYPLPPFPPSPTFASEVTNPYAV